MSLYTLLTKQATQQTAPTMQLVVTSGPYNGANYQAITFNCAGTGTYSATVQMVVSNDAVNWSNMGSAVSLSNTTQNANASFTSPFLYWGAMVTALTGTCNVTVLMSTQA